MHLNNFSKKKENYFHLINFASHGSYIGDSSDNIIEEKTLPNLTYLLFFHKFLKTFITGFDPL